MVARTAVVTSKAVPDCSNAPAIGRLPLLCLWLGRGAPSRGASRAASSPLGIHSIALRMCDANVESYIVSNLMVGGSGVSLRRPTWLPVVLLSAALAAVLLALDPHVHDLAAQVFRTELF